MESDLVHYKIVSLRKVFGELDAKAKGTYEVRYVYHYKQFSGIHTITIDAFDYTTEQDFYSKLITKLQKIDPQGFKRVELYDKFSM